jgi:hypothetical protein
MKNLPDLLWAKWRRFQRLPSLERTLILRAMVLLPLTEVGLRAIGFRRWKQFIEQFSPSIRQRQIPKPEEESKLAERYARAVFLAERNGVGTPNCLERSLTLWWLLRCGGIEGELHIGARKNDSKFEAHAWVELRGTILNDSPEVHQHYARFDAPISAELDRLR